MMTFAKTDKSLTIVIIENGKTQVLTTTTSNPRWAEILIALTEKNQNKLVDLISPKKTVETYTESSVVIRDGNVYFKDKVLHGLDCERLLQFAKENIPFLPLARFLEKKAKNPSYRSINELYKFLEHRKMPLTPEGKVIGYKGIRADNYSVMGNKATVVTSGTVNEDGHILNVVGAEIRCDRSSVCDDYKQGCSPGLHIGSLEYALSWGSKVVLVEFDPADVVSVPDDCNCQKLRACAYKVVGEYTIPLVDTYSTEYSPTSQTPLSNNDGFEDLECDSKDLSIDYTDGYNLGVKEGKGHKARTYVITDLDDQSISEEDADYIKGYNDGYRMGRYNK